MFSIVVIFGILSAVGLSGFFSGIETAVYSANIIGLQTRAKNGCDKAAMVLKLFAHKPLVITTMLIGTNLAIFIATSLTTFYLQNYNVDNSEVVTTLILTPFCFLFAESIPKRIAFGISNKVLVSSARVLYIFQVMFLPLSFVLGGLGSIIYYIIGKNGFKNYSAQGRVRLFENLEAKVADGGISKEQYALASRIMALGDINIAEFALLPSETFTIAANVSCHAAGEKIISKGFARALLTGSTGVLNGKIVTVNAIVANEEDRESPVEVIAEDALLLKKSTPIIHAISTMRKNGARIAIVTNKQGVFVGTIQLNTLINSIIHGVKSLNVERSQ